MMRVGREGGGRRSEKVFIEGRGAGESSTLPLLFSTQIAFFFWSMHSEPARTEVMVDGGVWRRPGPSLSGRDGLEGMGRTEGEMTSPGITIICVAIGLIICCLSGVACCPECKKWKVGWRDVSCF